MAIKKYHAVVAAVGIVVASAGAYLLQRQPTSSAVAAVPPSSSGAGVSNGSIPVEVARVELHTLQDETSAVGSLRSRQGVMLRPEVSGRVARLGFNDGQRVRRGHLLVQLDDTLQQAHLQKAQAEASIARTNLQRNRDLVAQKFVSQSAVDQTAAVLEVAQASVALAQAELSRMRIVAPFDGTVGIRVVNVGDYVKDGADLLSIDDTGAMLVDFRLPERVLSRLKVGQVVDVALDGLPGRAFKGRVDAFDSQLDANGRSLLVRARLDNPEGVLKPGMFARARLVFAVREKAIVVPEEALVPIGGKRYILKVVDNGDGSKTTQRVEAQVGLRVLGKVEILNGLAPSDLVVTGGQARLMQSPEALIKVIDLGGAPRPGTPGSSVSGARAPLAQLTPGELPVKLAETSVRRPVFATVMSLLIILVGFVSFSRLQIREYPRIDEPVVNVTTKLTGASSEVIESQVTKPLEDSIAGIEGVDIITSISRSEQSQITVRFKLTKSPEDAAADVRDRVSRVRARLPDSIDEPVIAKVEADATPVIWLAFSSDTLSPLEITELVNRLVKPRVQTVAGVADVQINGDRQFSMRIWVDPDKLASFRMTVQDVEDALRQQNLEVPAGRIESRQREFSVTAQTDLTTVAQFADITVKTINSFPVKLRDVARIEQAALSERNSVRLNGVPSVGVGVIRQATANPLEVAQGIYEMMPRIQQDLPAGVTVRQANDNSIFIDKSVKSVYRTIGEAVVLVALVVFVFLRTLRASIIPLVTIPVSLIGVFGLMALAGFTVNTLTLLALVLAIGLVVDDAIVMLENIFRHIEEGMAPFQAAIKGANEVAFAILAMTMTLAAVFAPLAFTPGRTGRLFVEFALTLAGAVIVSGFTALTLTPMMCSKLLRHNPSPGRFDRMMEASLVWTTERYEAALRWTLGRRWLVLAVMGLSAVCAVLLFRSMKSELAPIEDRGVIMAQATAPDGSTLEYTERYMREIEKLGAKHPEFDRVFVISGNPTVSQGIAFLRTTDWDQRDRSTIEIARAMQPELQGLPGVNAFPVTPPSLGQGFRERAVNFVVVTSDSYQNLSVVAQQMMAEMAKNPGLVQPDIDLRLNKPEIFITVDRDRAADAGVPVDAVARSIETMLGGRQVTRYKRDAEQYDVIVQTETRGRSTPEDIDKIFVRGRPDASGVGPMIPLSSLLKVRESVSPRELNHFNQRRSVSITANLAPGYSLGEALDFMDATAAKVLKPGYSTELNGVSREFRASSGALALVFVLALLFIFLVLSAQFESFVDPFVIMLSVPLSMVGALGALQLAGGTLNVYSQIGLITLVGLITKHGILIVEFSNQLRQQGLDTLEATVKAASLRLRPILMTTGAMVLGALPLALAHGAGAESRQQIGWVIVGGMTLGTLLTIFVVPTMYTLFARKKVPGADETPVDGADGAHAHA